MNDGAHQLRPTTDPEAGYTCERCELAWKQPPTGFCPGVKIYQYASIPWNTLTTYTQLRRMKLKPANPEQPDGCYFRLKGKEYIHLYKIEEAQPRRTPPTRSESSLQGDAS